MSPEERNSLQAHFGRSQKHVKPKSNPLFARYKFRNVTQGNDSMEQFITKLKTLVKDCNYNGAEEMTRDAIVFDLNNKVARGLLSEGANLTLDKVFEYTQQQLKLMKGEVDAIAKNHALCTKTNGHRNKIK